jgi:hypothetical protein
MLAALAGALLPAAPARAGHWAVSYASTLDGNSYGGTSAPSSSGAASPHTLVVTATLTWTKDSAQDTSPPPAFVNYIEKASASVYVADTNPPPQKGLINEKDSASDGLGDPQVPASGARPPNYGSTSSGSLFGKKPGAATVTLDTRTLGESLSYDAGSDGANGGYGLSYSVSISDLDLSINPVGAVKDRRRNWDILIGQQCSPTLAVNSPGWSVSGWQWAVSGSTFQSWTASTSSTAFTGGPGPLNGPLPDANPPVPRPVGVGTTPARTTTSRRPSAARSRPSRPPGRGPRSR